MSRSDEQAADSTTPERRAVDPIAEMHEHILGLETELAAVKEQLKRLEQRAVDAARAISEAFAAGDHERVMKMVAAHEAEWEARDEEAGLLKADMRVLNVMLDECREWLAKAGRSSDERRGAGA